MLYKLSILCFAFSLTACTELTNFGGTVFENLGDTPLTSEQVAMGLKEALEQGITKGADIVSEKDGFFGNIAIKILFPEEAQKVQNLVEKIPGGDVLIEKFIVSLNRAAEDAAKSAKPIFVSAIKGMTIQDAMDILLGGNPLAATEYLERTTSESLNNAFYPVVDKSLKKIKVNDAWAEVMNVYNAIPFHEPVNTDLNQYVTDKALVGLFHMVGKEEQLIRKDPIARTTELMKKVFARQDNN